MAVNVEYIENYIGISWIDNFKTHLTDLKTKRNCFAHTYTSVNSTVTYPSPSSTQSNLQQVVLHLKRFDNALKRLRFK